MLVAGFEDEERRQEARNLSDSKAGKVRMQISL